MKASRYVWVVLLLVFVAACAGSTAPAVGDGSTTDAPPSPLQPRSEWGEEPVEFFNRLAVAYNSNDFYGVLDFYAPGAEVDKWRADNRGGSTVVDLLRWNSADLDLEIQSIHLGEAAALALVRWPSGGDFGAVVSTMDDGLIAGEVAFDLAAPLAQSLRASPTVIAKYADLYAAYAEAWSAADADEIALLYSPEAPIRDPLVAASDSAGWDTLRASDVLGSAAPSEAPAVFLGPSPYGRDPQHAIGLFRVTDPQGCERQVAVRWVLDGSVIIEEHHYHEVVSIRQCGAALPQGWWTGLSLPGPADQVATGTVQTASGKDIEVHNGTRALEELVQWGLGRFATAGMEEPRLDQVTFEPSRSCVGRSGRVLDDGSQRRLFVCMYETDLCTGQDPCELPATSARLAVLHELGHVWVLDGVDATMEQRLLELSDRDVWDDPTAAWSDRGVEYAAEVIAWGLIEEALTMERIGAPPCEELLAGFELLTGTDPLRDTNCP